MVRWAAAVILALVWVALGVSAASADIEILKQPLALKADFPNDLDTELELDADWTPVRELRLAVTLPEDCPPGTTMLCYLKDAQWNWYQVEPSGTLKSGRTNVVRIDMSPGAERWLPRGHSREWDGYVAQKVRGFGVKIFNRKAWSGAVRIDRITGRTNAAGAGADLGVPLAVTDLHAESDTVARYGKYELSFDLARTYANPFDPDEIDVRATFTAPSGKTFEQFGFFTRDYVRRQSPLGDERLTPVGRGYWKVRFAPTETGQWTVALTLRDACHEAAYRKALAGAEAFNRTAASPKPLPVRDDFLVRVKPLTFECTPSASHGFIHVDSAVRKGGDPYFFSYDDGTFFYPIGQMLRSPADLRLPYPGWKGELHPGEGTFGFDRMMGRLSASGVNFIRVWMSIWWVGLEAPEAYAPGYAGLGQYNMGNAWKLDHIMGEAARLGLTVKLNLNNHGQLSRHVDQEFFESAYNVMNGGMLRDPADFWTDEQAKDYVKRRMRYVVARWGWSPNVFAWELWNEVDLTEGYDAETAADWHREFARYLKSIDPYRHMISTHFYSDGASPALYGLAEIEFTPGDLYQANVVTAMRNVWLQKRRYRKPTFISEYGVGHDANQMEANFHGGLWSSTVVPMAGTAMFWWWNLVDVEDLYGQYKPVALFNAGEDRRGKDWTLTSAQVRKDDEIHNDLRVLGRQCPTEAFLWVYDSPIFNDNNGDRYRRPPAFTGATLTVPDLAAGQYRVEFWDTTTGRVTGAQTLTLADGDTLKVALPEVKADIAVKVKRVSQP